MPDQSVHFKGREILGARERKERENGLKRRRVILWTGKWQVPPVIGLLNEAL